MKASRRSFLTVIGGTIAALALKLKGTALHGRDFEVAIYTRHLADGLWYHRAILITGGNGSLKGRRWTALESPLFRDDGASQMKWIKKNGKRLLEEELQRPVSADGWLYVGRELNTVFQEIDFFAPKCS